MEGDVINVKVKPNSASNEVMGIDEHGFLRVNIKAPAQKGKANKERERGKSRVIFFQARRFLKSL